VARFARGDAWPTTSFPASGSRCGGWRIPDGRRALRRRPRAGWRAAGDLPALAPRPCPHPRDRRRRRARDARRRRGLHRRGHGGGRARPQSLPRRDQGRRWQAACRAAAPADVPGPRAPCRRDRGHGRRRHARPRARRRGGHRGRLGAARRGDHGRRGAAARRAAAARRGAGQPRLRLAQGRRGRDRRGLRARRARGARVVPRQPHPRELRRAARRARRMGRSHGRRHADHALAGRACHPPPALRPRAEDPARGAARGERGRRRRVRAQAAALSRAGAGLLRREDARAHGTLGAGAHRAPPRRHAFARPRGRGRARARR